MSAGWLPNVTIIDLHNVRGNGPFGAPGREFLGVILHVNVSGKGSNGTSIDYFRNNPGQVCPTFQVYKDGSIVQFLPLNWQPWCQIDGNFNYGAIETGGDPDEPLTDLQRTSCARIVKAYRDEMGLSLTVADSPGQKGIGTHQMGGLSWGGHACPGDIRAGQRKDIIALVRSGDDSELEVDGVKITKDELNALIDERAIQVAIDFGHAALLGEPRTPPLTHTQHGDLIPGNADNGLIKRVDRLEAAAKGKK